MTLRVRDDGKGIPAKPKQSGMGLHTMRYRATIIGGSLEVRRRGPRGTIVTCTFPDPQRAIMKTKPPLENQDPAVEDHEIVRQGIARIINQEADMEVCGEAEQRQRSAAANRRCSARISCSRTSR